MNVYTLLKQLNEDTYTRLGVSEHGIGVFAIKKIPKCKDPFIGCMENIEFVSVSQLLINKLDDNLQKLVKDFCPLQDGFYEMPSCGLKAVDQSYYLNHSNEPNMFTIDEGENFLTSRDIEIGEELTVDYNFYDEAEEVFKNKDHIAYKKGCNPLEPIDDDPILT